MDKNRVKNLFIGSFKKMTLYQKLHCYTKKTTHLFTNLETSCSQVVELIINYKVINICV